MNISPASSAINLINNSHQKANEAAQTIANLSVQDNEVGGSKDIRADTLFKPVVSLKEAELETKAGVKILQTDKEMQDSILDVFA